MSAPVQIVGGGFAALVRAAEEARQGARIAFVEPRLRAGGSMATESFLSPFRFNLGPALVPRPPLPALEVLEPQLLLDVAGATLTRAAACAGGGAALQPAFGLFLGIDPDAPGAAGRIAAACAAADELVLVAGGNGLAASALVDELVAGGSTVVEGVGAVDPGPAHADGLGVCRLFLGLRGPAREPRALATAVGFEDTRSLLERLDGLRTGELGDPLGFLVSNAHLDANVVEPSLSSLVFQWVLPFGAPVSRAEYTERVLAALDLDPAEVIFRLLWLPEDTGEHLR